MNSGLKSFKIQKILTIVAAVGFTLYAVLFLTSIVDTYAKLYPIMNIVSALLLGVSSLFLYKYANSQGKNFSTNTKPGWAALALLLFGVLLFVTEDVLTIISYLSYLPIMMSIVIIFSRILAMLSFAISVFCFNTGAYKPATILSIITTALMLLLMLLYIREALMWLSLLSIREALMFSFFREVVAYNLFTLAIISYSGVLLLSAPLHKESNEDNYQATLDNSFEANFLRNINNSNDD